MNGESILYYPIGEIETESPMLEQIKELIAQEATRLVCVGGDTWFLVNYMNAYRLEKEKELKDVRIQKTMRG